MNTGNADNLLREIHRKSEKNEKKENNTSLALNLLLKFMSKIYQEKIKQDKNQIHVPLHVNCYEFLLNRYGLKHVVDQNLKKVLIFHFLSILTMFKKTIDFFKLLVI